MKQIGLGRTEDIVEKLGVIYICFLYGVVVCFVRGYPLNLFQTALTTKPPPSKLNFYSFITMKYVCHRKLIYMHVHFYKLEVI